MSHSTRREPTKREQEQPMPPPSSTQEMPMQGVEDTIVRVEGLYRSLTGHEPPPIEESAYAPIPPESDPRLHVERQIDRLLGALAQFGTAPEMHKPTWVPEISVWEGDDGWLLCVDLPGVTRDQVHVHLESNVLVISGERTGPVEEKHLEPRWLERRAGAFRREIPLPQFIAPDVLRASMKEGVLEIRLPRLESKTQRADIAVN